MLLTRVVTVCASAVAGRARAQESASSATAASAPAERTGERRAARGRARPGGRPAADAVSVEGRPPRRDGRRSASGETLDARRSTLDARRSTLDARRSTLDARRSTLDARRSTLDARRSFLLYSEVEGNAIPSRSRRCHCRPYILPSTSLDEALPGRTCRAVRQRFRRRTLIRYNGICNRKTILSLCHICIISKDLEFAGNRP